MAAQPLEDTLTITPLGSGQEVGRSCHLIQFRGRTVLLDCGIHPGRSGLDALPFLDTVDLGEVDLMLVSHFHIDHAAGVPYITEKTNFQGRVFMTHPTKAVMRMLLSDYIRLLPQDDRGEGGLYDEEDLARCCDRVELVDFHQVVEHEGIRFWSYNAGHVLGAAMFMIEIGGVRLLYTGDYSLEEDRHLVPAEVPTLEPHVLIMESTYGTQKHESRDVREALFTSTIERIVQRGGRCLIPVFALGRAQELLLILDEYWKEREDLQRVPVFYASKMASRALRVYQTYINMMNMHVRDQMDISNPFKFDHVQNLASIDDLDDSGPVVVLAAPGMLQSGVSRQLFDRWASSERNGVVIAGYSVEGTLAKQILSEPDEETGKWPSESRPTVSSPENGQAVNMRFARDRRVACVGAREEDPFKHKWRADDADAAPEKRRVVKSGILVSKDLRCTLYADDELRESSPLSVTSLRQTLRLQLASDVGVFRALLAQTFADADAARELVLAWDASPLGDVVADAVVCVALHCQSSPAALLTTGPCCVPDANAADDPHGAKDAAAFLRAALVDHFGDERVADAPADDEPAEAEGRDRSASNLSARSDAKMAAVAAFAVTLDDLAATCTFRADGPNFRVDVASDDDPLRRRLRTLLERALDATQPISTKPRKTAAGEGACAQGLLPAARAATSLGEAGDDRARAVQPTARLRQPRGM
ncbi:nuclease [Aureococcus anophagefferens]|nr:nuclease [Aureococcus anophagefferens]